MGADKKNIIPFLKKMLGSIPVMHIKIKNQNPFVSETSGKVFGCQGDVVEKTEPHGLVPFRMMTGGTNRAESIIQTSFCNFLNRFQNRTNGLQGSRKGLFRNNTIRTLKVLPSFFRSLTDLLEQILAVKHGNVLGGCLSSGPEFQLIQNSFGLQTIPDRSQAFRIFRMRSGIMFQEKWMGVKTGFHGSFNEKFGDRCR
tara:strand:- start:133 stop:726 length:594 start_codon:yes stop_codon:yes gene_type:complete